MAAFKNKDNGTWYVQFRYTDWKGERQQKLKQMNEELAKTGCITIAGRIDRKFFHEKFYGTRSETERKEK